MASKYRVDMVDHALRPEVVLSEENKKNCIKQFQSYDLPKVHGESIPEAAVLVPLCMYKGELGFLYTLRSIKLTSGRGQVSFPGGKRDKEDTNLIETALRETWEELRISKEKVDVWAKATLLGKGDVNVLPVLGYIGEVVPEELEVNCDEVEEAFVVSLQNLCDPQKFHYTRYIKTYTLPSYLGGKYRIWGFTGAITHIALQALLPQYYTNKLKHVKTLQRDILTEINSHVGSIIRDFQSKL